MCFLLFFLGSPEGEKKIRFFFYSFCRDKNTTLFSLGTNRERERERMSSSRRLFPEQRDEDDEEEEEEETVNTNDALVKAAAAATTRVIILLRSFLVFISSLLCAPKTSRILSKKKIRCNLTPRVRLSLSLSLSLDSWKRS